MICVENVTKMFKDVEALKDVNLNIDKGSIYGLIGSNGAGKSTLMRTICGVYKPERGTVTLDGQRIYENDAAKQDVFFILNCRDSFFCHGGRL